MDIKKYIYSHCVSPVTVNIWDSYTQSYQLKQVPCGKCLHCRNSHINEWVTRLYAQSQYSNYVYYITLDYAPFSYSQSAPPVGEAYHLSVETAACWHSINSTNRFGLHPLLLRKNHLQDFFKRLRKNNGIKFQYFACGEYGTHANGQGFGRPHFHAILFSDVPITETMITKAWSVNSYQIGSVKYEDITLEAKGSLKNVINNNAKSCFKYVAKYLQKSDFVFEKLATIDFHRAYFKSLQFHFEKTNTLFPELVPTTDPKVLAENWKRYCSEFAPFVVCSRRPSLGLAYLQDNVVRFKSGDFRLFGLSEECDSFPRYFIRKTKESLCSIQAVGQISQKPSSSSTIGSKLSLLRSILDSRLDFANFSDSAEKLWYKYKDTSYLIPYKGCATAIPFSDLHLYDTDTKYFYQFVGYGYNVWHKVKKLGYVYVQFMDIQDVLNFVTPKFGSYYDNYVVPMHHKQVLSENELTDSIKVLYNGDYSKFMEEVYATYNAELLLKNKHDLLTQNSRNSF